MISKAKSSIILIDSFNFFSDPMFNDLLILQTAGIGAKNLEEQISTASLKALAKPELSIDSISTPNATLQMLMNENLCKIS